MTDEAKWIEEAKATVEPYSKQLTFVEYTALVRAIDSLLTTQSRHQAEEIARLRAALERLVADYGDVPDATDADAQAIFADARAALSPLPIATEIEGK